MKPNPLSAGIIILVSLALLYKAFVGHDSIQLSDQNIFEGTVSSVISTDGTQQRLFVRVSETQKEEVINDFVPVSVGQGIYFQKNGDDYYILDIKRTNGLYVLGAVFALLVFLVGGKKGIYALVGLLFSMSVIFAVLLPRILAGDDPILVGLYSSVLILLVTLYVTYGINRKSLSAFLGIAFSLLVTGLLANYAVGALHLSGYGAEESFYLQSENSSLNLAGLLIAGIIIAAIGVLDDIAVTQAAIVFHQSPMENRWEVFRKAMAIGKDHISAVVNTLVLAYAGAALPLLLLLSINRFPLEFILNGEILAEEIVRTLISSIGLVLAVPFTTLVAVFLRSRSETPSSS